MAPNTCTNGTIVAWVNLLEISRFFSFDQLCIDIKELKRFRKPIFLAFVSNNK